MSSAPIHIPVLLDEVLDNLGLRPGATVIDATMDGGGHAAAMLERIAPNGKLLGLERDGELVEQARERFATEISAGRVAVAHASFRRLGEVARALGFNAADAILFDVGVSSYHFEQSGRGFSFSRDEPLDLRFDPSDPSCESAAQILASRDVSALSELLRSYGEERHSARIASAIVSARSLQPLNRTGELFDLIVANIPARERRYAGRSAARVFQALRIEANDELEAMREGLSQALELLSDRGRLAVISFHSLEDRLTKRCFADAIGDERVIAVTKRAVRPSAGEIERNSRAASAKLRVVERRSRSDDLAEIERLLRFWLGEDFSAAGCEDRQQLWFRQSDATDNYIRERFGALVEKANHGALSHWAATPRGRLALIVLLDQFNRNLRRGSGAAFSADAEALRLCVEGIERGDTRSLRPLERAAFGMPLEHCERIEVQEMSVRYFTDLAAEVDDDLKRAFENFRRAACEHRDVIGRFGRFPNRAR